MKVYIVVESDYDFWEIKGVFADIGTAQELRHKLHERYRGLMHEVYEQELRGYP